MFISLVCLAVAFAVEPALFNVNIKKVCASNVNTNATTNADLISSKHRHRDQNAYIDEIDFRCFYGQSECLSTELPKNFRKHIKMRGLF